MNDANYEMVIRPSRAWFDLDVVDIWRHRDLLALLVHREFAAKYRQTILGPAWFIVQPLLMSALFAAIFGGVAHIPTDGAPPLLFYLAGLLGWNYFAQTFQGAAATFTANAGLFGKVYFPRLVAPLSTVIANFIAFGLQLAVLIGFWGWFKVATPEARGFGLDGALVWFPLVVVQLAALSLGAGLWLSALTAKYRDFSFLVPFLLQVWMYATPVIYPLSRVPPRWRWIADVNPMSMPTEAVRRMLLGAGEVTPQSIAISVGVTLSLLIGGLAIFGRVEKTFVDTA